MSAHRTLMPEVLRSSGRVLFNGQATTTGAAAGFLPAKSDIIYVTVIVTMADATDLALGLQYALDAVGGSGVTFPVNVPLFLNDSRENDGTSRVLTSASGTFVIVFCVPTITVPAGTYLTLAYLDSNAANILTAVAFEDTYNNG